MLDVPWVGIHDHTGPCRHCQMTAMWFQLAHSLMDRVFAKQQVMNPVEAGRSFGSVARNESLLRNRSSLRIGKISIRNTELLPSMRSAAINRCKTGNLHWHEERGLRFSSLYETNMYKKIKWYNWSLNSYCSTYLHTMNSYVIFFCSAYFYAF